MGREDDAGSGNAMGLAGEFEVGKSRKSGNSLLKTKLGFGDGIYEGVDKE